MYYCHNISKEKHGRLICEKINFRLSAGEAMAIRCDSEDILTIAGLFSLQEAPTAGQIETPKTPYLLFPEETVYEMQTPKGYLKLFAQMLGIPFQEDILKQAFSLNDIWEQKLGVLSKEQVYRVKLARLSLMNAPVIISVYPSRNIEAAQTQAIENCYRFLQEQGKIIIYLSRYVEELIPFSQHVYTLKAKKLTPMIVDTIKYDEFPIASQLKEHKLFKIQCRLKDKILLLKPDEIEYIESNDGATYVAFDNEMFKTEMTLTDLEKNLVPYGFFRCHRSYLVNLQQIKAIITIAKNTYVIQINDTEQNEIPLSRAKIQELKNLITLT